MNHASCLLWVALFLAHPLVFDTQCVAQTASVAVETKTPSMNVPFTLQIQVEGSNVRPPQLLEIDGLDLASSGQSTSINIVNGRMSRTSLYNYQAMATKEGTLTIPSIVFGQGTTKLTTKPLILSVKKGNILPPTRPGPGGPTPPGSTPNTNQQPPAMPAIDEKSVFLKVVPEREQIYAGEAVEVKVKAYIDDRISLADFDRQVTLQGEDFVFQPVVGPDVSLQNQRGRRIYVFKKELLNGQTYKVLTFRTSLTAVKPGSFSIASVNYVAAIVVPRKRAPRRRRSNNPFDSFLGGNPFDDPFFDNVRNRKRLELTSEEVSIEVLPLPSEGRPEHFEGAIGRFTMDVTADKPALNIDDTLTLSAKITGHGNFDRISNVAMEEDPAWRAYPPKILFKSADELGISGEKTFQNTMVVEDQTEAAPMIRFAYFDPESRKYVSLESKPHTVMVTGTKVSAAPPLANATMNIPNDLLSAPALKAVQSVQFMHGQGTPLLASASFLTVNGLGLASLIGLLAWQKRSAPKQVSPKQQRKEVTASLHTTLKLLESNQDSKSFAKEALTVLAKTQVLQNTPPTTLLPEVGGRETLLAADCLTQLEENEHTNALGQLLQWANTINWSKESAAPKDPTFLEQRQRWLHALQATAEPRL